MECKWQFIFLILHYNSIDKEIVDDLITININDKISFSGLLQ